MRKFIIYFILFFLIAYISVIVLQYREKQNYISIGEKLIEKIEIYRSINKKLPETLSDINEPESMGLGPYYNKIDCNQYEITFCLGFDDYMTYNSREKKWLGTD